MSAMAHDIVVFYWQHLSQVEARPVKREEGAFSHSLDL